MDSVKAELRRQTPPPAEAHLGMPVWATFVYGALYLSVSAAVDHG